MRRREFIAGFGGAAAWPLAVWAQQPTMPVIGFLASVSRAGSDDRLRAFQLGLSQASYFEGRNVAIEYCWADGQFDRLPAMAADLVRRQVRVIATTGGAAPAQAAKSVTTTIPIVFTIGDDPVRRGLVASLNRPGGNLTGSTTMDLELEPKRLQLLHEMVPAATVIGVLVNPADPTEADLVVRHLQAAARTLGLQIHVLNASTESEIDDAFETLARLQIRALVIGSEPFFFNLREHLGALTVRHKVPAIYQSRDFAAGGGLMSYTGSLMDGIRLSGLYTGRILKGEKPADLPVQQSARVELIINLKTAKALGITVPETLLATADEVIR